MFFTIYMNYYVQKTKHITALVIHLQDDLLTFLFCYVSSDVNIFVLAVIALRIFLGTFVHVIVKIYFG